MKLETDPITEDEWLIRAVWTDRVKEVISANAFEPRGGREPDIDGISLFRRECLTDVSDALNPFSEDKRPLYGLVQIPVSDFTALGLHVRPAPRDDVPGHVVVPEINVTDYAQNKARFTPIKKRLAEIAGQNIIRRPIDIS